MRHPLLAAGMICLTLTHPLAAQETTAPPPVTGTSSEPPAAPEAVEPPAAPEAAAPEAAPEAPAPDLATNDAATTPSSQPAVTPLPTAPTAPALDVPPVSGRVTPKNVTACTAVIGGVAKTLGYDPGNSEVWSSRRERWGLADGRCPAKVVIADMAPELSPRERGVFCLQSDPLMGFSGLAMGERDASGMCEGPSKVCRFVNATGREAREVASATANAGVQAVQHQSGALIMQGSTAGLTTAMSGIGSAAAALMSAPLALAGAAASVVVVGGAVWVCGED